MQITIRIEFCEPAHITQEITQPDILLIRILLPALLIDAESFDQIQEEQLIYELEIQPQKSQADWDALL